MSLGTIRMAQPTEGSFVRWQATALTQLGYAVNLILGFATASLGFSLALIKDKDFAPGCLGKHLLLLGLVSLMASIVFGVWCVINRLSDFRKTRGIARDREKWQREKAAQDEIDSRLALRRSETCKLGKRTWKLFYWQIGTFGSGAFLLVTAFAVVYHAKLF